MSKPDEVRDFLGSVWEAKFRFQRCVRKIEELSQRCENITSNWDAGPRGGGDVHKDGALVELAFQESEKVRLDAEWTAREKEVEAFLDGIRDRCYQAILKLRYVDLLHWSQVMDAMEKSGLYYSERQIYNLHGQALDVARALWREKGEQNGS